MTEQQATIHDALAHLFCEIDYNPHAVWTHKEDFSFAATFAARLMLTGSWVF